MKTNPYDYNVHKLQQNYSPHGDRKDAFTRTLKGFDIGIEGTSLLPPNTDRKGYVFFTRPQLNLSGRNCIRNRLMYNLLTRNPNTLQTWIRCTLDPRLYSAQDENCRSDLIDNRNPFIPMLTNALVGLTGWPDIVVPTYTSPQGLRKQSQSIVDGALEYLEEFDLDAEFFNTQEEPILNLFQTWEQYMTFVTEGILLPYMDFIAENEIDYNTRIYRIVTDKTDTYVSKIAACGAALPISLPHGRFADYKADAPLSTDVKTFGIRFRCNGAMYKDQILMQEFNETVAIFNPRIATAIEGGNEKDITNGQLFFKVPFGHREMFNNMAFPYIDLSTNELCWLVDYDAPGLETKLNKLFELEPKARDFTRYKLGG